MSSIYIKPGVKELLENIDNVPINKDRYFILKREQVEDLRDLVAKIDNMTKEEIRNLNDSEKLELSTYINNAERLIWNGVIQG